MCLLLKINLLNILDKTGEIMPVKYIYFISQYFRQVSPLLACARLVLKPRESTSVLVYAEAEVDM